MADHIYLVTSGEYSNYHVIVACPTKELADAYAQHCEGSYDDSTADVEACTFVTELPPLVEILTCSARMLEDGSVYRPEEEIETRWAPEVQAVPPCRVHVHQGYNPDFPHLNIEVRGTDLPRVRKVMSEVLARCKANIDVWFLEDRLTRAYADEVNKQLRTDG